MFATRYSARDFADAFAAAGIEVEREAPNGSNNNNKQRRGGTREQPEPVCTLDRGDYIARCIELLTGYASSPREFDSDGKQINGPALQLVKDKPDTTGGGDDWTCRVARNMGDEGISETRCYELMKAHFNAACVPPWKLDSEKGLHKDKLRTKITNAYATRVEPIGSKTLEADGFRHSGVRRPASRNRPTSRNASRRQRAIAFARE
jgi:hypothetical protein